MYYFQIGSYSIEATSNDGIIYRGNWGWPDLDDKLTVELTRFEGKNKEIMLFGRGKTGYHIKRATGSFASIIIDQRKSLQRLSGVVFRLQWHMGLGVGEITPRGSRCP